MNKLITFKNKRGFTLVELMVAIVIVAILASIGLVTYGQTQKSARDGKRKGDIREIQKALEQYYAISRDYPATLGSANISNSSYFPAGAIPVDPTNNTTYRYVYYAPVAGTCTRYIMCATLENNTGNRNAVPANGCEQPVDQASPTNLYCLGSMSN